MVWWRRAKWSWTHRLLSRSYAASPQFYFEWLQCPRILRLIIFVCNNSFECFKVLYFFHVQFGRSSTISNGAEDTRKHIWLCINFTICMQIFSNSGKSLECISLTCHPREKNEYQNNPHNSWQHWLQRVEFHTFIELNWNRISLMALELSFQE